MEPAAFALALQIGDSAFPTGAFAHSSGLERLARDGLVDEASVRPWIAGELRHRWAPLDRVMTAGAWAGPAEALARDAEMEACLWSAPGRVGSRAVGRGIFRAAERLGILGGDAYGAALRLGSTPGHAAVVEGRVWALAGLGSEAALIASGTGYVARLASAAIRLGLLGALAAQTFRAELADEVVALARAPLAPPASQAPLAEIALMRHDLPGPGARLFAT